MNGRANFVLIESLVAVVVLIHFIIAPVILSSSPPSPPPLPPSSSPSLARLSSHSLNTMTLKRISQLIPMTGPEALLEWKEEFLSPLLIERVSGTPGNVAAREFIVKKLNEIGGWDIELDTFTGPTPFGIKEFSNIIATKNPQAPQKLVLAAHYDSKYFRSFRFIGATDSAASCALLLDLARTLDPLLSAQERNKDITLQLIFFDGEEAFVNWTPSDSIYGARHLAEKWEKTPLRKPLKEGAGGGGGKGGGAVPGNMIEGMDLMVLLDLIGHKEPLILNFFEETSRIYGRMQRIENRLRKAQLLRTTDAPAHFFASKNRYGQMPTNQDDHIPFLVRGVPILHVIPYPFPPVWHRYDDDEAAVDLPTLDDFGRIMKVFVCEYLDL